MNIVVCVKQVDGELNPFDACALECALKIKDTIADNTKITVISMGRKDVENTLQRLTRLGVDRSILLCDNAFAGADTLATSYALSKIIKTINPQLILCGRQSIDGDTAQVGPCIAAMLGISVITNVLSIDDINDNQISCTTRLGKEQTKIPIVLTVERINTLRFPSIRSKPKDVENLTACDIGADISRCGLKGSPTRVLKTFESTLGRRRCKWIAPEQLDEVIKEALQKENTLIETSECEDKFDEVWTIGNEPMQMAKLIAKNVRVIEKQSPQDIVRMIHKEQPKVVLWDSGIWGRRNAPQVAAMLQTGLCADCTKLEVQDGELIMYRPAFGGSIMAKIMCETFPKMATVRTAEKNIEKVILSLGMGVVNDYERLQAVAKMRGFGIAASRAFVDKGFAPYEWQAGLTGRTVSPKVYIACGISGAVHHTCAIERAETVIAINPDKNARIFDYADYGILCESKKVFINSEG